MLREAAATEVTGSVATVLRGARLRGRSGTWSIRIVGSRITSVVRDSGGRPSAACEIDLRGLTVLPGFHDPHVHVLSMAQERQSFVLDPGVSSAQELRRVLSAAAAAQPGSGWLRVRRFDHDAMTDGWVPDRHFLDEIAADRPVRVQHRNLRLDLLNTAGLARCGIFAGGAEEGIEVDGEGSPTGRVYQAGRLLRDVSAPPSDPTAAVAAVSEELLRRGVTSIQDAGEDNGDSELRLLGGMRGAGTIRQRLWAMVGGNRLSELLPAGFPGVRVRHAKFTAVESQLDLDGLAAGVLRAREVGLGVAIHATSEAEVAAAVFAICAAREFDPAPAGPGVYRIEHANVCNAALVEAVHKSGAAVVANPALLRDAGDSYLDVRGLPHDDLHRLASWQRIGTPFALASDAPVSACRPLDVIQAAVDRRTASGIRIGAHECLDDDTAIDAATLIPAVLVGCSSHLGSVGTHRLADLVVVYPWQPGRPADSDVVMTFAGGRLAYACKGEGDRIACA